MYLFNLRPDLVGQPTFVGDFLTAEQCASIITACEATLEMKPGGTEDGRVHDDLRSSEIAWLGPDNEYRWLFDKIRDCVNAVNSDWFRYDLVGFEGLQFTKYAYRGGRTDFYSSHVDTQASIGTVRKLSFTIQLSDPESYEGGNVVLYKSLTDTTTLSRARGSICFFPSYTIHEVVPVTRGVRHSLVGWVRGPAFT